MSQSRVVIPFPVRDPLAVLPEVAVTIPKRVVKALVGFAADADDVCVRRMAVLRFYPSGSVVATDGHVAVYKAVAAFEGPAFSVPVEAFAGMLAGRGELTVTRERVTDGRLVAHFTALDEIAHPFPPLDDCMPDRRDDDESWPMGPIGVNLGYFVLVERLQHACEAIGTRLQFGKTHLDPIRFDLDNGAAHGVIMPMNIVKRRSR